MSERITNFHDLRVYREACELDEAVFEQSRSFPPEEMTALTAPLRGAARAIGGHIAAAWSKRRDAALFRDGLREADARLQETRHWLGRSTRCRYLDANRQREMEERCDAIGRMLGTMIRDAGAPRGRGDPPPPDPAGDPPDLPPARPGRDEAETRPRPAGPGYSRSRDYSRRP